MLMAINIMSIPDNTKIFDHLNLIKVLGNPFKTIVSDTGTAVFQLGHYIGRRVLRHKNFQKVAINTSPQTPQDSTKFSPMNTAGAFPASRQMEGGQKTASSC